MAETRNFFPLVENAGAVNQTPLLIAPETPTFPAAWSEQGLKVGTDGTPRRPNGEFASRSEVGFYLSSLIKARGAALAETAAPERPTVAERDVAAKSSVPREISDGAFFDVAAAAMRTTHTTTGTGEVTDFLFASTALDGARTRPTKAAALPKINLNFTAPLRNKRRA